MVGGRVFAPELIERIREAQRANPQWTRCRLAREVCQWTDWRSATGQLKEMSCRKALLKLHRQSRIELPAATRRIEFRAKSCEEVDARCHLRQPRSPRSSRSKSCWCAVRTCRRSGTSCVSDHHDLGYRPLAGAQLRYLIRSEHGFVAALGFRSAALRSQARDRWIGWSDAGAAGVHRSGGVQCPLCHRARGAREQLCLAGAGARAPPLAR